MQTLAVPPITHLSELALLLFNLFIGRDEPLRCCTAIWIDLRLLVILILSFRMILCLLLVMTASPASATMTLASATMTLASAAATADTAAPLTSSLGALLMHKLASAIPEVSASSSVFARSGLLLILRTSNEVLQIIVVESTHF